MKGHFEIRRVARDIDLHATALSYAISGEAPSLILTSGIVNYVPPVRMLLRLPNKGDVIETTACFPALKSYTKKFKRLIIVDIELNNFEMELFRAISQMQDIFIIVLQQQNT